jgi:hypothetical protein
MKQISYKLFLAACLTVSTSQALKLDRAIIACDRNETYLDFWPLVAQAWTKFVGVKPTLALIAPKSVPVNESFGEVLRFEPIPGIPSWFYAQVIRLFLPIYFPNDVCITSDMDMLPIRGSYFIDSIKEIADDKIVFYRANLKDGRYPICYVAGKGSTFQEIFQLQSLDDIPQLVYAWYRRGFGWDTDEVLLKEYAYKWHEQTGRCVGLGHSATGRIDRGGWQWDPKLLKQGYYIEAHMIRPYKWHKAEIDKFATALGLDPKLK